MITMDYNPVIPQPPDIPSDSQSGLDSNFIQLNDIYGQDHIPFGNLIEEATSTAPIVITSPTHRLSTGNQVTVFNMEGMLPTGAFLEWPINEQTFTVTVTDENTFSLDGTDGTDEELFPPYLARSGDFSSIDLPYGKHLKNFFQFPLEAPPNRASPKTAYFTQEVEKANENVENLSQLFFQNDDMEEDITQLTDLVQVGMQGRSRGWRTPWGLIINTGFPRLTGKFTTHNFVVPFTNLGIAMMLTRDALQQIGDGTRNPVSFIINLRQFNARIETSGREAIANCRYWAIGF